MISPQHARVAALVALNGATVRDLGDPHGLTGEAPDGIVWTVGPTGRVTLDAVRPSKLAALGAATAARMRIDECGLVDMTFYTYASGLPFTLDDMAAVWVCADAVRGAKC